MEGWIKLYRSSLNHWLYSEKRPLTRREAWENMLMLVNNEDDKVLLHGTLLDCKRGQSLMSLNSWAKEFSWSVQMVRTFFKLLEADKMIVVEGLQKTTRLTICNYGKYQDKPTDKEQTKNRQITDKEQTDNRQITDKKQQTRRIRSIRNKRSKEVKNISLSSLSFVSPAFLSVWEKWVAYKKKLGKPYKTIEGMEGKYHELVALSGDDPRVALLIVDQSINNEWSGLFELKNKKPAMDPHGDIIDHELKLLRDERKHQEELETAVKTA